MKPGSTPITPKCVGNPSKHSTRTIRWKSLTDILALLAVLALVTVTPPSTYAQTLTVLHTFTGGSDGAYPHASLVMDAKGNLYGTTYRGGPANAGTVFEVNSDGVESVLHTFTGGTTDGGSPNAGLVLDSQGNLYGTTIVGGAFGAGTVFKLTNTGGETILYSFKGLHGAQPYAGLLMDTKGNLYGTTCRGGV